MHTSIRVLNSSSSAWPWCVERLAKMFFLVCVCVCVIFLLAKNGVRQKNGMHYSCKMYMKPASSATASSVCLAACRPPAPPVLDCWLACSHCGRGMLIASCARSSKEQRHALHRHGTRVPPAAGLRDRSGRVHWMHLDGPPVQPAIHVGTGHGCLARIRCASSLDMSLLGVVFFTLVDLWMLDRWWGWWWRQRWW